MTFLSLLSDSGFYKVCVMLEFPFFFFPSFQLHTTANIYIINNMATLEDKSLWEAENDNDDIGQDILRLAPEEITNRARLLENDIKVCQRKNYATIFLYMKILNTRHN
jgi:hypothetical protein